MNAKGKKYILRKILSGWWTQLFLDEDLKMSLKMSEFDTKLLRLFYFILVYHPDHSFDLSYRSR